MELIMQKIIEVAALLVLLALIIVALKAREYMHTLLEREEAAKLDAFVDEIVGAADQLFKADDPTGGIRLDYVFDMLVQAGYELTDALRAKIENKVLNLGHEEKVEATAKVGFE